MTRGDGFRPAWWLPGAHLQTLWPVLARRGPRPRYRRERLELPDGDFLDLDWCDEATGAATVLVLHGLEGCSDSQYVRGLVAALGEAGWRSVVMHFRGCSGEPNRLARSYNAGDTGDIDRVVRLLRRRDPRRALACVGYSLGGNALLRWLAERGGNGDVQAAVAVSVPFLLGSAAERMRRGASRLYQSDLLRRLRASYRAKFRHRQDGPVGMDELARLRDFYAFDDRVTAPLHGYAGAGDYYARASSRQVLARIRVPTLILHAADDPFMTPAAVPNPGELSDWVRLELSRRGGHVGFVAGRLPWRPVYWLEERIPAFLAEHLPAGASLPERHAPLPAAAD